MITLYCLICGEEHQASDKNDVCCGDVCKNALHHITQRGVETEMEDEEKQLMEERIRKVMPYDNDSGLIGASDG